MNRAFSTVFHNGEKDEKPIVSLSCRVNNGGRFKNLDSEGTKALIEWIEAFEKSLSSFKQEIKNKKPNDQ